MREQITRDRPATHEVTEFPLQMNYSRGKTTVIHGIYGYSARIDNIQPVHLHSSQNRVSVVRVSTHNVVGRPASNSAQAPAHRFTHSLLDDADSSIRQAHRLPPPKPILPSTPTLCLPSHPFGISLLAALAEATLMFDCWSRVLRSYHAVAMRAFSRRSDALRIWREA